ncbi:PrgH/EprH family type III secretion apparatus protein [Pseudomonas fluorescens]|uniref:Protein PrgH n=1 Tax=Pseudomonas fluorescens TaxID=294 RepID=A0A5E7GCR2_PSEFL|nr:PrgH/EprH family type III secretion apparatus protein [Pseudomonas fluorescens]VVO48672.1 Protein PrgH [Pseudomonas fluorescens]
MQELPATTMVLKIFNGFLQGCEFRLNQPRTLFVVGSEAVFCVPERLAAVPEDAIYVPFEGEGCNFELLFNDQVAPGYVLRLFKDEEAQDRACELQTLQKVAGLRIAVKSDGEDWTHELGGSGPSLIESPVKPGWFERFRMRSWLLAGVAMIFILGAVLLSSTFLRPSQVSTVESLIAGSNSTMTVLYGRDRTVYVFADSERDANWGRQVLVRNGYSATQVLTPAQERIRLEAFLADLQPQLAYHYLDLSNPTKLRLLISGQRNQLTPDLRSRLETKMLEAAPYALEFSLEASDDNIFEREAEQGLKRLGINFNLQRNTDSVNFSVVGSLDDGELHALTDYILTFQQQWGGRYVNFTIELKDDWLKGKSFQYGPQSYIKMTPSSWYFPQPL